MTDVRQSCIFISARTRASVVSIHFWIHCFRPPPFFLSFVWGLGAFSASSFFAGLVQLPAAFIAEIFFPTASWL